MEFKRENVVTCFTQNRGLDEVTAQKLESGIFKATEEHCKANRVVESWSNPLFYEVYKTFWRKTDFNVLREPELLTKHDPEIIASLSHQTLDPPRWEKFEELRRMKLEHETSKKLVATTSLFTCSKCKGTRCNHRQSQTRSADEPMTTFVTCLDCGNCFRFS
jgi:hypothetical protein